MITGSDVIVTVILYTLLRVLPVEIVLFKQFVEQFVFYRHLFFTWEETHISISVLHLECPCVISDIVH